jgi:hypothetical protein
MAEQKNESDSEMSSIGRVNDELVLGDDRAFEAIWWRIEVSLWIFLTIVLLLALTGLLGKGPLAHKALATPDKALELRYERIARYNTPAIIEVRVHPQLFRNGKAYIRLSRTTIKGMGAQRIIPQPEQSLPDDDGISYIFPVEEPSRPLIVTFALQPSSAGLFRQEIIADPSHDLFFNSIILP